MKYLLVTDIPAPWREKVYENVYKELKNDFHVVYCNYNEKRRLWKFPLGNHSKTFLKSVTIATKNTKENYLNPTIIPFILKHRPKVIICFSLVPTIFITLFLAKLIRSKIIVFADTWFGRDRNISLLQKWARKLAYGYFPDAYIGASRQTLRMYKHYNKNSNHEGLFLSPLCADNDYFNNYLKRKNISRKYDIMFSGRIVETKNPLFIADVAGKIKERRGQCSLLIIGDGDERIKNELFNKLKDNNIDYHYAGFVEHNKLPEYYSQARLLLLPTSGDCWGVVINEAMVSGVPVITTEMTAAAGELVIDEKNGYVLPMDPDLWAERIISLLEDPDKYEEFSKNAKVTVEEFNFNRAAMGILSAIRYLDNQ